MKPRTLVNVSPEYASALQILPRAFVLVARGIPETPIQEPYEAAAEAAFWRACFSCERPHGPLLGVLDAYRYWKTHENAGILYRFKGQGFISSIYDGGTIPCL